MFFSLIRISIITLIFLSLSFSHTTHVYAGIVFGCGVRGHQGFSQGTRRAPHELQAQRVSSHCERAFGRRPAGAIHWHGTTCLYFFTLRFLLKRFSCGCIELLVFQLEIFMWSGMRLSSIVPNALDGLATTDSTFNCATVRTNYCGNLFARSPHVTTVTRIYMYRPNIKIGAPRAFGGAV